MIVENLSKNTVLANDCSIADNFISRFIGLMGKKEFPFGKGLLIKPCNSIHMFFMKLPLDIIFLDGKNQVVELIEGIKPWHTSKIILKAKNVLELPAGTIKYSNTEIGDLLAFCKN